MNHKETTPINEFEQQLANVVGTDLAHDLVSYAKAPDPLDEIVLRQSGVRGMSKEQRNGTISLISEYSE
jgi:hypothetical protein